MKIQNHALTGKGYQIGKGKKNRSAVSAVVSLHLFRLTSPTGRARHAGPPARGSTADGSQRDAGLKPKGTAVLWLLSYKHLSRTTAVPYGVQSQNPVIFILM